jgi:hypothetical protein
VDLDESERAPLAAHHGFTFSFGHSLLGRLLPGSFPDVFRESMSIDKHPDELFQAVDAMSLDDAEYVLALGSLESWLPV